MIQSHDILYEQLKFLYTDLYTRKDVLRRGLCNYRHNKGLSLEYDAFKYLSDGNFYEFIAYPHPLSLNSRELVLFDKLSASPYYINKQHIYISDPIHQFTFSLVTSFTEFIEYLKG